MMERNKGFINEKCERCGNFDWVLSELHLMCNYGSKYEGEDLRIVLCGKCADVLYEYLLEDRK